MSENRQCTNSKKKKKRKKAKQMGSNNDAIASSNIVVSNESKSPLHTSMELLQVASKHGVLNVKSPTANRKSAGTNWLQAKSGTVGNEIVDDKVETIDKNIPATGLSKSARLRQKRKSQLEKYVAMDCEMVGVGCNGTEDMLARVSIVNKRGEVLLDKFVKPRETVTDYRTCVSGIRPHDIENAEEFQSVQNEVVEILQGKILVGHAIRNDLAVLHIKHPFVNIRDTARYKPLCRLVANGRTPSLKRLSQAILGLEIQTGEHNSVEDARATMNIYNRLSNDWEKYLKKHQHKNCK